MFTVEFFSGRSWVAIGEYVSRDDAEHSAAYVAWHRASGLTFMGHHVESVAIRHAGGRDFR